MVKKTGETEKYIYIYIYIYIYNENFKKISALSNMYVSIFLLFQSK